MPPRQVPHAPVSAPPAPRTNTDEVHQLALDHLEHNPFQTRTLSLDQAALGELAASIKAVGVVQPIVVRPVSGGRYQVIAGERRWEASRSLGLATIPAIVRQVSNEQAMEMTIIENLKREDLNAMEQARAYERLRRLGERDHAEPKGQAQTHLPHTYDLSKRAAFGASETQIEGTSHV